MTSTSVIPEAWRNWLIHNRDRGCARQVIVERAVAQGYLLVAINAVLNAPAQPGAEQALSDGLKPPAFRSGSTRRSQIRSFSLGLFGWRRPLLSCMNCRLCCHFRNVKS